MKLTRMIPWMLPGPLALAASLAAPGCGSDDWGPDTLRDGKGTAEAAQLEKGRAGYAMYCAGCHGDQGDGNGPAAKFLNPKPRNLMLGRVKFASVASNSLPTDDDYLKILDHGLAGTAMPTWRLIPLPEQKAIVAYIRRFYPQSASDEKAAAIAIAPDPWARRPAAGVAEGEKLYHGFATCHSCHPAYVTRPKVVEYAAAYKMEVSEFRPGLYDSVEKESDWGAPIRPPDFVVDRLKYSQTLDDLAQVIATGVGGTAMPSWGSSLTPEQLWGLAHYVHTLTAIRNTPRAAALRKALDEQPAYVPPPPPPEAPPAPAAPPIAPAKAAPAKAAPAKAPKK